MSVILTEVWKSRENSTICMSTEDMMAEMNKTNDNQKDDNMVLGSTDVLALYRCLNIDFAINIVCDVFFESSINVRGVDHAELGLYLALTVTPELLTELGVAGVCPTRKTTKVRPATVTASGREEQK